MPITINGTGSITGISAGGLPDLSITTADIADAAITRAKMGYAGAVLQAFSHTTTNTMFGTLGGGSDPAWNQGSSYTTFTFTPTSATSKLLLISSNICVRESANSNDVFYAAAYYDTTRICVSNAAASYYNFANNCNAAWISLQKLFNSWGTTQKTIDIRVGAGNGTGANMQVNRDDTYPAQQANPEVTFTILEIAG